MRDSVLAVMVITASCVLSPSSAKKSVKKAVPNIFQSMRLVYQELNPANLANFANYIKVRKLRQTSQTGIYLWTKFG